MATFYKYKERDDISKSMIDWSGITKEISDNLMKEKNRRDDLKQKLEEDQLNKIKAVEEFTQGLDPSMNQTMMKVSQQYKDYLLSSHKLMKSGFVSVNDTKIRKQGAIDTFNSIDDAAKNYNEKMSEIINTGGNLNEFFAKYAAEALDIANSELVIDNMGRGTFIKLDEDGNEVAIPAQGFATLLNTKYDRFDANSAFDNATKNIAETTIAKSGYFSVTDFRQKEKLYNEWLENSTKYILNSDKKIAEVAADLLHIDVVKDKYLAEEEGLMYSEWNGVKMTINTEFVKDKVKSAVQNGLNSRLDYIEKQTPKPIIRESESDKKARAGKKSKEATFNNIIAALQGNEEKYKTVFDPYENVSVPSLESGSLQLPGKNAIELRTDKGMNTIGNAGGRWAAQLGFNSEEFEEYARKKGVNISGVNEDVLKYGGFENVQPINININTPLTKGGDTAESLLSVMYNDKVDAFNINEEGVVSDLTNILSNVASKAGLDSAELFNVSLKDNNTIRINVRGMNIDIKDNADLNTYRTEVNKAIKLITGKEVADKKRTIPQIMEEDGVSRTEAIKIFNNQ